MRISIDVGGTFTDVNMVDDRRGEIYSVKTLTTPGDLSEGVCRGIEKILSLSQMSMDELDYIAHGATTGTNALIERKGAKTGLICTEGFRDVLEIGRIMRPEEGLYDFSVDLPPPLVPRYLRREVRERIESQGNVLVPLDEDSARECARFLKREGVSSIAISLLFSYVNPIHERRVREICREVFPEAYITMSSEICPEYREYERTSTAVINAYLQPIIEGYITNLVGLLEERYGPLDIRIIQANGGVMTAHSAKTRAVNTVNSGPAGGVVATSFLGQLHGERKVVSVDMGGTSFDIGLVEGGVPKVTTEGHFQHLPVKIPIIDLHIIGAGGGSIAWIDVGGALNVGPMSAGADPGPACYNLEGDEPTVTDANLVLGRLNPEYFNRGEMPLFPDLARESIEKRIAGPLNMSVERAAMGIIQVINANMVKGITSVTIQRGIDTREWSLVSFGGSGGLHALDIARDLNMRRAIIPPFAGTFSAIGLLVSDTRHDYVQTITMREDALNFGRIPRIFRELEAEGRRQLQKEHIQENHMEFMWSTDIKLVGQTYEINTPVERGLEVTPAVFQKALESFKAIYREKYSYIHEDEKVEVVSLRVSAFGKSPPMELKGRGGGETNPSEALKEKRPIYFDGMGFRESAIYERDRLGPGCELTGPCMIEEATASTLILPGYRGRVEEDESIAIAL